MPPQHTCRGAGLSARAPNQRPVRERAANQRRHAQLPSNQVPPRGRRAAPTVSWLTGGEQGGRTLLRSSLSPSLTRTLTRCEALARRPFTSSYAVSLSQLAASICDLNCDNAERFPGEKKRRHECFGLGAIPALEKCHHARRGAR